MMRLTRRVFLRTVGAFAGLAGLPGTRRRAWGQTSSLADVPTLDGGIAFDETARRAAANDWGGAVHRVPLAVVQPGSVDDVAKIVTYANRRGLKVAMRGRGHSVYGQAQVEGGIVIDSSSLSGGRWAAGDMVDVDAGALWGDVANVALTRGFTPPVMVDAMMLSVGGILSVGGLGETSYRLGGAVDHVAELDVVTGRGARVTCSPERNAELFSMMLAGLGQCGIITRARLRLVRAPAAVSLRTLLYDDLDPFLADAGALTGASGVGPLASRVTKTSDGRWQYALVVGTFVADAAEAVSSPAWMSGLRFKTEAPAARLPYAAYLERRTASIDTAKAAGKPNPALALALPASSTAPFLVHALSSPELSTGVWLGEVYPLLTAPFARPLMKLPAGPLVYAVRLQRRASADNASDHRAMLEANNALVPRIHAIGGKIYPPYAPVLARTQWRDYYGAETWRRFAAAKQRFDPGHVLNPGAGIF